jgi:hypothetical protein
MSGSSNQEEDKSVSLVPHPGEAALSGRTS